MPDDAPLVTAAEISRLAGVTRATVSNWRRRHPDFPDPAGGSESRPLFDLLGVQAWLREHGVASTESPLRELRTLLRAQVLPRDIPALLELPGEIVAEPDGRWISGAPHEVVRAIRSAVRDSGPLATIDVLAERGLEESPTTGAYSTPRRLALLMADIAADAVGAGAWDALDPACGSGVLLRAAIRRGANACYGQDVLPVQAQRTAVSLPLLSPDIETTVRAGDSLTADAFPGLEVGAVLCNPPFGQRDWGADELTLDTRWQYGVPARVDSELAWVQHALAHLRPNGVAVLLLPPSVGLRGSGRRIRGELLRQGALRAVIGLPPGVALPRQVGLQLWVLRRPQPDETPPAEVLFVDTARQGRSESSDDWDSLAETVLSTWRAFDRGDNAAATVPDVAAVTRVMDILDEDVDLTPARHVRAVVDIDRAADDAEQALHQLAADIDALRHAADGLAAISRTETQPWRTVTVSDLVKGGALQVLLTRPSRDDSPAESHIGRPLLTGADLARGGPPSKVVDDDTTMPVVVIEQGDVLLPQLRMSRDQGVGAQVAGDDYAGAAISSHVILLRPDPSRLDAWFLAGFASGPDNAAAMQGATTIRVVPQRLRIPLLPLTEQRRYGAMFERLHRLRRAARRADESAARTTALLATGLTAGALEPQASSADPANNTAQIFPEENK